MEYTLEITITPSKIIDTAAKTAVNGDFKELTTASPYMITVFGLLAVKICSELFDHEEKAATITVEDFMLASSRAIINHFMPTIKQIPVSLFTFVEYAKEVCTELFTEGN